MVLEVARQAELARCPSSCPSASPRRRPTSRSPSSSAPARSSSRRTCGGRARRSVYEKFADYKPRPEPASGLAGGKQVFVDRVEWVVLPDAQTAVNALIAGEIDMMQQPPFDMLPLLEGSKGIKVVDLNPLGTHFAFRFNTLHKPFDDPRIRAGRALCA